MGPYVVNKVGVLLQVLFFAKKVQIGSEVWAGVLYKIQELFSHSCGHVFMLPHAIDIRLQGKTLYWQYGLVDYDIVIKENGKENLHIWSHLASFFVGLGSSGNFHLDDWAFVSEP